MPAVPAPPAWLDSKEFHDLAIFFAQTVISWGVPAVAIGAVGFILLPKPGQGPAGPTQLPPALAKALGMSNDPKEYLKIEKLNDKLTSFEFSFQKATASKVSALRAKSKADVERQFGAEFKEFGLSQETVDKVFKAAAAYRQGEEKVTKRLEAIAFQFREATLNPAAAAAAAQSPMVGAAVSTVATAGGEERTLLDKVMYGSRGKPPADSTGGGAAMKGVVVPTNGKALQPLVKEKASLEEQRTQLELDFLRQLSSILTKDQAATLAAVLKQQEEQGGPSVTGSSAGGPTRLDTLAALVTAASEAAGKAKRVYVLKFFGDVTASQVAQLRQEVTAVLQTADVAGRGDEVVLVLNTGGGTVTGYGLAGAQLQRLKKAGLHLTICVEQVAASGGYLMACTADRIVAAPFAVLGSIGVITEIPNVYERLQREGVAFSTVTAGKYKRTLTPTKKIEEEDLAKTKEDIEGVLRLFKRFVAENRPQVDIDEIATGETWLGPDALERKMVDELATVDDVLLQHVQAGAEVLGVTYKEAPKSPLAALAGAGAEGGSSSVQSLALSWLAENVGRPGAAGQLAQLQAVLEQSRGGQSSQGGMLQMPREPPALAQRPTDAAEPMLMWGDEPPSAQDTWFL